MITLLENSDILKNLLITTMTGAVGAGSTGGGAAGKSAAIAMVAIEQQAATTANCRVTTETGITLKNECPILTNGVPSTCITLI